MIHVAYRGFIAGLALALFLGSVGSPQVALAEEPIAPAPPKESGGTGESTAVDGPAKPLEVASPRDESVIGQSRDVRVLATPSAVEQSSPDVGLPPPSARWGVLTVGVSTLAVSYGSMVLMGGLWTDLPGGSDLFIPVAGPWMALGQSGCAPGEETTEGEGDCGGMMGLRGTLYVLSGLLQAGSLGVIGESIFMKTADEPAGSPTGVSWAPIPWVTERSAGLGVVGTF